MTPPDAASLLPFFKALADESRLRIVGLLAVAPRNVQDLARTLGLKEPTVSHHLAIMREAGLVTMRIEGTVHWYALEFESMRRASRAALSRENLQSIAAGVDAENWEREVLRNFFEDGKLREIPVQRKKRWAVLKWLAGRLQTGIAYPENKLNALLKQYHWDCATIRREMIGYKMLARKDGVYTLRPKSEWHPADD